MSQKLQVVFSELEVKLAELKQINIGFNQEVINAIKLIEDYLFKIQ